MDNLSYLKSNLGIVYSDATNDAMLTAKINAVINYCKNAGVSEAQLETNTGKDLIIIGAMDLLNQKPGEVVFSPAFDIMLNQLMVVSAGEA